MQHKKTVRVRCPIHVPGETFADHFGGPGRASLSVCVSCVRTITSELNDLCWFL